MIRICGDDFLRIRSQVFQIFEKVGATTFLYVFLLNELLDRNLGFLDLYQTWAFLLDRSHFQNGGIFTFVKRIDRKC